MHKKCSWKLRKIPCNVKPIETNSRQRFRISRVNFWFMYKVTTQSTFVISNESTVGRFQSSIWKWNFDSNNAIRSRVMKIIPK